MPRTRPAYPEEFRHEAAQLLASTDLYLREASSAAFRVLCSA